MKELSEGVARLDQAAQDAYDKYLRRQETAKAGARAGNEAKELKQELVEALGEHSIGELPDGRRLVKVQKNVHKKAQPARDDSWWELTELLAAA